MAKIIGLPKLSPTMDEGVLVAWIKKEGDSLEVDELIAEVETDKATVEFRSFDRGVLLKILAPEGSTLKLDEPVAIIGKEGEDISELLKELESRAGRASEESAAQAQGETGIRPGSQDNAEGISGGAASEPSAAIYRGEGGERVLASPLVRKMARERSIDLATVGGSGPRGRIIKRDLEGLDARASAPSTSGMRLPPEELKASPMRKTIARRLTQAKQEVPHFYLVIDVDAEGLVEARAKINSMLEEDGVKISYNDLVVKAAALALRQVPEVNSSFAGDTILRHRVVDMSIAVAIPDGLVTPVLRDADKLSLQEINRAIGELAAKARDRKLRPEEMSGGTFSISNLGMFGIDEFSAVINPPEGAILAVSALRDEAVIRHGMVSPGKKMKLTLSCDHRVIDGAVGAEYMRVLRQLLEEPIRLLAV